MLRSIKIIPTSNGTTSKVSSSTHLDSFLLNAMFFSTERNGVFSQVMIHKERSSGEMCWLLKTGACSQDSEDNTSQRAQPMNHHVFYLEYFCF